MLLLHHLENSRSQRIAWALEVLKLEYEVKVYQRTSGNTAPESLKRVHPLGHAPVLQNEELTIAESGAILEFLADEYDTSNQLRPVDKIALRKYRYWLHFAEGSFMPLLVMMLVFRKIPTQPMPFFVKPIAKSLCNKVIDSFIMPRLEDVLALVEKHLQANEWFAGEARSAADMQMSFPLLAMRSVSAMDQYPSIERWLQTIRKDSDYQRAVERVGEFKAF